MNKKGGQILTFAVTFIVAFSALCAIVATAFATGDINSGSQDQTSEIQSKNEYLPIYEHQQNILFIVCDWRGGQADLFCVVKINPIKRKFNFAVIPAQTEATVNIRTDTVAGHYDYGGSVMAADAVSNACGIKINRYVRIARDDLCELIDELGGVEYDVEQETKTLNKGFQTLDGRRMTELIFAQKSCQQQADTATKLIKKLINTSLRTYLENKSDDFFKRLTQLADTSLNAFDYEYRKEAIKYITEKENPADSVRVSGRYDPEEDVFLLSDEALTRLQSVFWQSGE